MTRLMDEIERGPLAPALRKTMSMARSVGDDALARWCRLELDGYWAENPALTADVTVPEYRTVCGQHRDLFGRPLVLEPNLAFVGQTRLRNGVEELEALERRRQAVLIQDPNICRLIKDQLGVEVHAFEFSPVLITGILGSVRTELSVRAQNLGSPVEASSTRELPHWYDILSIEPGGFGVNVDVIALVRRLWNPR